MKRKMILTVLTLSTVFSFCFADTIHVPADQPTIQAGINAAANGDTVLVAPGTYEENIDFLGKAITLKSSDGYAGTMIDGGHSTNPASGSTVTFQTSEGRDSVIDGFSICYGTGSLISKNKAYNYGGGIFCYESSPTIINNHIALNSVEYCGGGIFCREGTPLIANNIIEENSADRGGGIYCNWSSYATIENNTISLNNVTDSGGGIYCSTSYTTNPSIINNVITTNTAGDKGGGISCYNCFPLISMNTISGNSAESGGGVACDFFADPEILNNTVTGNSATENGGGIFCDHSDPAIEGNTIEANTATEYGGGIFGDYSDFDITHSTISLNSAKYGGGMASTENSYATVVNSTISENTVEFHGAGIYCDKSSPLIKKNLITENITSRGGGAIFCHWASPVVLSNRIVFNQAGWGGGIVCEYMSDPSILNNMIYGNIAANGGAIYCEPYVAPEIINNTITANSAVSAGGIRSQSTDAIITNTIVWGNGSSEIIGDPIVTYSNIKGQSLWPGTGNINRDPLFVDPANNDFHLAYDSPCIDVGLNLAINEIIDFESDPRHVAGVVDMGADEFYTHLYYTGDATPGGTFDLKLIEVPPASALLFIGSDYLANPIQTMYGAWYLVPPYIPIYLGSVPGNGFLSLPVLIPPDCPTPLIVPAQCLGRQLTNLMVLEVM